MYTNFNHSLINNNTLDLYIAPLDGRQQDEEDFDISNLNFTWNVTYYHDR